MPWDNFQVEHFDHLVETIRFHCTCPGANYFWSDSRASYSSVKLKVRIPCTLTGAPSNLVGLNTHCSAARTAASRNNSGPLMAMASITRPSSEIVTCTVTLPETWAPLASGG